MNAFRMTAIAGFLLVLSGCQVTNRDLSCGGGALLGGIAGSFFGKGSGQLIAVGVGSLAGYFAGCGVYDHLSSEEQVEVNSETIDLLGSSGDDQLTTSTWSNPDTGNSALITAEPASKMNDRDQWVRAANSKGAELPSDAVCRRVRTDVSAKGQTGTTGLVYCRNSQGDWQPIGEFDPAEVAQAN